MLESTVLNTDYDLAEMKDLCLPNLLDNADFKSGIINQRGQDSYTGSASKNVYTVDRWSINTNTANTLSVEVGYISCTLADNGLLTQYIDSEISGAITCAIKLKDEDLKVVTVSEYSSENEWESLIYDIGELETGVNVKVVKDVSTTKKWRLRFQNLSGSSKTLNIEYIKLEKGSAFTGMPQWDYVDELLNCQRFFYPLGSGWIGMFPARSDENTHSIYIQTPVIMRTIPTLIVKDGSDSSNALAYLNGNRNSPQATQVTCSSFTVSETNIFVVLNAPLDSTAQIGYGFAIFQKPMALDAEIY